MVRFNLLTVFVLSRLADMFSTLLNVYRFGYDPSVELSVVNRHFLEIGVDAFLAYQMLIIFIGSLLLKKTIFGKYIILGVTVSSLVVATINIATLIYTFLV